MDEVAFEYEKLIKKIKIYQNGIISESIKNFGFQNLMNYGVSVPLIDKIAASVPKSNNLAFYCWNQPVRESKLLAIRILESGSLKNEEIDLLILGIENSEIAEQLSFNLFGRLQSGIEIALKMIKSPYNMAKYCGLMTIHQIAINGHEISDKSFKDILNTIQGEDFEYNVFIKNGLSKVIVRIASRNQKLRQFVTNWLSIFKIKNQHITDWLDQEVMYYLVTKN